MNQKNDSIFFWHSLLPKASFYEFLHLFYFVSSLTDSLAHIVIPLHPKLKPHSRMLHHFRFLNPLLTKDEDGVTPLHYYDSAIQLARNSGRDLTEEEFEVGITAAYQIEQRLGSLLYSFEPGFMFVLMRSLNECRLEMLEPDSSSPLDVKQL